MCVKCNCAALKLAVNDVRPHVTAWIKLLTAYVATLPEDGPVGLGDANKSYAQHELNAMSRDLNALIAA